tara:strand:+ start:50 stop:724 length:675 start_codon:yes stop_codon:yes gene_type:complete
MNVLELFSGSRSIGKEAEKRGNNVFSSDFVDFPNTDYVCDIMNFDINKIPFDKVDMLWASPPCESFSVASIGHHWVKGEMFSPKTENAKKGIKILLRTMEIIEALLESNPNMIWYVENPRGKMRKSPHWNTITHIRHTITYCQYEMKTKKNREERRMKPTDLWTNNFDWTPKPMCKNGDSCHQSAPRGSQAGTQGLKSYYDRSKIPSELCKEIIEQTKIVGLTI